MRLFRAQLGLLLPLLLAGAPSAGWAVDGEELTQTRTELEQLQAWIETLQSDIKGAAERRGALLDELKETEQRIGELARALREIEEQLLRQQQLLQELHLRRDQQRQAVERERNALARQIRSAHLLGRQERLKLLLNQQDPALVARTMVYYDYLHRERAHRVLALQQEQGRLQTMELQVAADEARLAELQQRFAQEKGELGDAYKGREELLAALNREIRSKDQRLRDWREDQNRLQGLLDKLVKASEETARRLREEEERRREEEAARLAAQEAQRKAEEEARIRAEKEAQRLAEAKQRAEEEARRLAEEKLRAEAEARRQEELEARRRAEQEALRLAEEKLRAEEEARRLAAEEARQRAEAEARRLAEAEARRRAEEEAQRIAEAKAKRQAEEEARHQAELERQHQLAEAARQREEAAIRAAAAARAAEQAQAARGEVTRSDRAQPRPPAPPPMVTDKGFRARKGEMSWPAYGELIAGFGGKKEGGLRWDGVLIDAPNGSEVRAVHPGEVVFAEWLRGYGLLLIIDHGHGYMTLYGHNQTLLHKVGDRVLANEPIALAGSSGGAAQGGVYFGVRYNGDPSNPEKWCGPPNKKRLG